jgi:predicted O-linked N-acetylglucosamine transferase (SPINDLY family)
VNHLISSIVALSSFKNTDRYLEMIRLQQNNFVKILALYSARNTVKFDIETIFRTSPQMASVWYAQYAQLGKAALPSDLVSRNLKEHVERLPAAFLPTTNLPDIYMGSTYVDGIADRPAKRIINESVQRSWGDVKIENTPNRTKIAVLARHWHKHHPAYRICRGYISSLRPKYHVTLFNLGGTPDVADFDDVRILTAHLGLPDIRPLKGNDFQALIYPDANGSDEAISLTNLRIAPIQIALLGHPVSTFGSKIDYFISGADVEGPAAGRHYSERVVFLPGMGCTHQPPLYELPTSRPEPAAGAMVINLPANARKLNAAYLNVLGRIMKRASRPLLMRFFTGGAISENNDYIPFRDSLADHLPAAQFEIIDWLDYADYMAKLREGHFSLDPFHMGGCNSVADSLYVRRPALCCEGDRWFNRIGPRMLRVAGLPELIARSPAEYEEIALRLIAEDDWRKMLAQRLASADLMSTLFSPKDGEYFRKALDYLIDHHQSLSNDGASDPIRINIDA